MSLADFYEKIAAADNQEPELDDELLKVAMDQAVMELAEEAQQEEFDDSILKTAAEYDAAGRIMARAFFDEMLKEAQDNEEEEKKEEEEGKEKEEEKEKEKKKKGLPPALAAAMKEKTAQIKAAMLKDPEFAERVLAQYEETE